ncbi:hypothetical protein CAPTEDRAFT_178835 [Capitella teleta]|uniref:CUB domain-containing protein n=1 Tax=Capitella teleta TaxID=283909 RepID=R7VG41_CAPTE|nr:hypothetical protein CAPTEDRAFT_178835 [Capitella teleta]|eukprot:ELU17589.1 hypothetical protein CAPTEDRAFT_178835 [Capitella teleta]
MLDFTSFDVDGVPPRCSHDFVDVFTRVRDPYESLLDVPLHGRYCGSEPEELPHLLVSMHNNFILGFYSDAKDVDYGFSANYSFIDDGIYITGTPGPHPACGQTIRGRNIPLGHIRSPTYPGVYPDNILCYYKLQGTPGQRIRFTFLDLDLHDGGAHCPFDHVKVYDGMTNEAPVIGTYCGKKYHGMSIYSTTENMHIEFRTQSGRIQRKGFLAEFEISNRFINLDFIHSDGKHVRGTQCDQRVFSNGETNGTINSPNYPSTYPLNVSCTYYIDGLVDTQNLEKVEFAFDRFDIPTISESIIISNLRCDNGYVKAYLRGQNIIDSKPDEVLCGRDLPGELVTNNPRLALIFISNGTHSGRGFRGHYRFVTNYDIPGTPASTSAMCHFLYHSDSQKVGRFNSPRHPANYPDDINCVYEFYMKKNERLRITFENFKVSVGNFNNCTLDYLHLYTLMPDGSEIDMGTLCNQFLPGPVVSEEGAMGMKINFHSNQDGKVDRGFRARYEFYVPAPIMMCNRNYTDGGGGIIRHPTAPNKYDKNRTCEYFIIGHQYSRILLTFDVFSMEGQLESQGCGNAVLLVYRTRSGPPDYQLCGRSIPSALIMSEDNFLRMKFVTSHNSNGAKGFRIVWTEIMPTTAGSCDGFKCLRSGYCISKRLLCDGYSNCGVDDDSDEMETQCGSSYSDHGVLHIILGIVVALVVIVFIVVCALHRRRKIRKKKNKKEIEVRYVTRGSTPHRDGSASEKMLKERTEKVSIV